MIFRRIGTTEYWQSQSFTSIQVHRPNRSRDSGLVLPRPPGVSSHYSTVGGQGQEREDAVEGTQGEEDEWCEQGEWAEQGGGKQRK